jgi:hypothetical protein
MVNCKRGCGLKYLRKNEKEHLDYDCLKNNIECEFCKMTFEKENEIDHLSTCLEFMVHILTYMCYISS